MGQVLHGSARTTACGASSNPIESREPNHAGQPVRDHPSKRWPSGLLQVREEAYLMGWLLNLKRLAKLLSAPV